MAGSVTRESQKIFIDLFLSNEKLLTLDLVEEKAIQRDHLFQILVAQYWAQIIKRCDPVLTTINFLW